MRLDKLKNQLDLILLLVDNRDFTIDELCNKIDISRRNLYYLIDFLKHAGFTLYKRKGCYHIDYHSPFIANLLHSVQFTDNEIRAIYDVLNLSGINNETINHLRHRLDNAYNLSSTNNTTIRKQIDNNLKIIIQAMKGKKLVTILGYSSPNSSTVRDRIVEPFFLMNNNQDVRCYELRSKMNKTFKVARMKGVELLDTPWLCEEMHKEIFTDIFMFSSEERHLVTLRMGRLAFNLFMEEYPQGGRFIEKEDESHWRLALEVCDYRGIGRFVLGLSKDIEILGNDEFIKYIREEIMQMEQNFFRAIDEKE